MSQDRRLRRLLLAHQRAAQYEKRLSRFQGFIQAIRERCHVDVVGFGEAMVVSEKELLMNPGLNDFLAMVTEFRPKEIKVSPLTLRTADGSKVPTWCFYLTAIISQDGLKLSLSVLGDSLRLTSVDAVFERLEIAGYVCDALFEHIDMTKRGEEGALLITLRRRKKTELN